MLMMNQGKVISETKNTIELIAPEKSDFFIDNMNQIERNNAPFYYVKRKGDFILKVRVKPDFKNTYDAGGLFIFDSKKKWIKLEFEKTDIGYTSIVSVITNGTSDDCNGEKVDKNNHVFLQIMRKDDYWCLYYSIDGKSWKMVRYFKLKMKNEVKIGIVVQSPIGNGCKVLFSNFKIANNEIKNIRKGK